MVHSFKCWFRNYCIVWRVRERKAKKRKEALRFQKADGMDWFVNDRFWWFSKIPCFLWKTWWKNSVNNVWLRKKLWQSAVLIHYCGFHRFLFESDVIIDGPFWINLAHCGALCARISTAACCMPFTLSLVEVQAQVIWQFLAFLRGRQCI